VEWAVAGGKEHEKTIPAVLLNPDTIEEPNSVEFQLM
jgi:hypothetical protein